MVMSDRIAIMRNGTIEQVGPAAEIYDRPTSAFVADFLGESNLWAARVVRVDADVATLVPRTAEAPIVRVRLRGSPPQGATVRLMLRPESLSILDGGAVADNELSGTVERIDITGPSVRAFVRTPFGVANARCARKRLASSLAAGATLRLGWSVADAVIFSDTQADKP